MEISLTKQGVRLSSRSLKAVIEQGKLSFPGTNNLVIDGPGEFEVQGMMITGLNGPSYVFVGDGASVGVLADAAGELDAEAMEQFSELGALVVPVGGALDVAAAAALITKLEPRYVVPIAQNADNLSKFLAEMGTSAGDKHAKLKLGKDMPEETTVMVLDQAA